MFLSFTLPSESRAQYKTAINLSRNIHLSQAFSRSVFFLLVGGGRVVAFAILGMQVAGDFGGFNFKL